jgi:C4-dicarboxylate transporter
MSEIAETKEVQVPKKKKWWKIVGGVAVMAIVIIGVAAGVFFWSQRKDNPGDLLMNMTDDQSEVVKQVQRLMELPDETPSVVTVMDKTKLPEQAFFAKAENGDKVLLYTSTEKAILYRPSSKKLIEVMPMILNDDSTSNWQQ